MARQGGTVCLCVCINWMLCSQHAFNQSDALSADITQASSPLQMLTEQLLAFFGFSAHFRLRHS